MAQELISVSQINAHLVKNYLAGTEKWSKALIAPGQADASVELAALSAEEVDLILMKLDMLALNRQNPAIAAMMAEEADSILTAIRMVKTETKEAFRGILGAGANLDIMWLRPQDVGGTILCPAATPAGRYLWAQTTVQYTWLKTWGTGGTKETMIPSQKMSEEGAVVHLGAIDPIEVPKCTAIQFTLSGLPAPPQSLARNIRKGLGTQDIPVMRFEKPIIIGPEKTQVVEVNATTSLKDTKLQLLSLLIAKAEDLTL